MTSTPRPSAGRTRRGRRPGSETSRGAVLDAARARFAADGFAGTTIRRVAADAGVDPSLVIQFFGSKEALFAAVMAVPPAALARFDSVYDGPDNGLGERVVRAFLDAWEGDPAESDPLMAMLRAAVSHEGARAQLAGFIESRLLQGAKAQRERSREGSAEPVGDGAAADGAARGAADAGSEPDGAVVGDSGSASGGGSDIAALRAGLAAAMLVGVVTGRDVIGVPVLAEADREEIVAVTAPAIQRILVG